MNNQKGVGLTELLIVLLLASLITIALIHHYQNIKQQYRHIQKSVEQSIDLQLVTDLIRDSVRRAGFTPCLGLNHLVTLDGRKVHKQLAAIEIDNGSALHINRMNEHFGTVSELVSPTELLTNDSPTFHRDQSIIVSDCYHAEVQTIRETRLTSAGQHIQLSSQLAFTYRPPIYVGAWLEEIYFVPRDRRNEGSLFYQLHRSEELTTVVHHLTARLESYHGHELLQVILGLDNSKLLTLKTMIRTI